LVDAVGGRANRKDLEALQEAISEFDFDGALKKLSVIEQECELTGK